MKKTLFIKNAVILTATSLLLRFIGIIFKVWLAALIGSEAIGLHQLIFSVYLLVSTFASSGIVTAVTRLCAEELALGSKKGTLKILRRSVELSLIIAVISAVAVYCGADFTAEKLLGDPRAAAALKILPFSLPFMGICSCIKGYFIARRRVTPNSAVQIAEQVIRIVVTAVLVKKFIGRGIAACCAAVTAGDIISEISGCVILCLIYSADKRRLNALLGRQNPPYKTVAKILHISVPITLGKYLNTLLRTAENILVPKNLSKFRLSASHALSQFGMIKGMALPVLFFPSAVLSAVSTLLIPEISEALAKKQNSVVKTAACNILKLTAVIAFIFSAVFMVAGEKIGVLIYKERDVGFLIKALSPIVPFMYLDSICDGILKGLDQQVFTFRTAISDSVIRIILIIIVLPKFGMAGFIGIMYFSNFLTCALNVGRLLKVSGAGLKVLREMILPLISAFAVTLLANFLIKPMSGISSPLYIIMLCAISLPGYIVILFLTGTLRREDILNVIR